MAYSSLTPARPFSRKGQTAIEYMILLGVVVALVLIAFKTQLPRMEESANIYFNRAMLGIIGGSEPLRGRVVLLAFRRFPRCPPDCDGSGIAGCP